MITIPFVVFQISDYQYCKNMFTRQNIQSIQNFCQKICWSAEKYKKKPPLIKLVALLVPKWQQLQGNSYNNQIYLQLKKNFFQDLKQLLKTIKSIQIQDFYFQRLSSFKPEQKTFFQNLGSLNFGGIGNCIDIIKVIKIIQNRKITKHLCLDLNTKIIDIQKLYNLTFNNQNQNDLLNACFYDQHYISAHNKILYCPINSPLAQKLNELYFKFIEINQQNLEMKRKNCIYSKVFAPSTQQLKYTRKIEIKNKIYFVADVQNKVFQLTKLIVSAIKRSWDINYVRGKQKNEQKYYHKDALIDIQAIEYIRKKKKKLKQFNHQLQQQNISQFSQKIKLIQSLKKITDQKTENQILDQYLNNNSLLFKIKNTYQHNVLKTDNLVKKYIGKQNFIILNSLQYI